MIKEKEFVVEDEIYPENEKIFNGEEVEYNFKCYDGFAVGSISPGFKDDAYPDVVYMTYPKRSVIIADEEKSNEVLEYRGLFDLTAEDITYGDIMMRYGKVTKNLPKQYKGCFAFGKLLEEVPDEVEQNENPESSREVFHCPECGEELVGGYNYDTGYREYECKYCGWVGDETQTQEAIDEMEEENEMEMPWEKY